METKEFNLTYPQKNIWLVEKLNGSTPINSIVGTIEIKNSFDETLCQEAIQEIIKNNDAMRFQIKEQNDKVTQFVKEYQKETSKVVDLTDWEENKIEEYKKILAKEPLNLAKEQLYEFIILRYTSDSGAIFMKIHHIISDAWSCSKIGTAMIHYMEKRRRNEPVEEIRNPSYLTYIELEHEYESSEKYQKDEEFWRNYLDGIKEPLYLKNVSENISKKASRYSVKLEELDNQKMNEYCQEHKISPYVLFLTALSTYLYRIKDQDDFIIGTPILNRSNYKEKNMIGMFVSTIPLRVKVRENETFLELAKEISKDTFSLFRHQKYPYMKMLEEVREKTGQKSNLYQLVLSYQNARTDVVDPNRYGTTWVFPEMLDDQLQIHIMDMNNTGILQINYDYLTDLFDQKEIESFHTRMMAIIKHAIDNCDIDVETIRIMSQDEEDKILYEWNDTDTNYPKDKTIIELFEEQVQKTPNQIALIEKGQKMTYQELNEKANQLARFLKEEKKVKKQEIVGIAMEKSFEMYIAILAVLKLDGVYLPIDRHLPISRINDMIENSHCQLVLTWQELKCHHACCIKQIKLRGDSTNFKHQAKPDDLAYIMYTSGSTGVPKGAAMYHYNVVKLVKEINYFDMKQVEVIFLAGSVGFDASMHEMWLNFLNGKTGCIISKETLLQPLAYQKELAAYQHTIAILTTQLFHQYAKYCPDMFQKVQYLVAGGDIMLSDYVKEVKKVCENTTIINIYGPTECSAATTTYEVKEIKKKIPIGKPISNSKCYICDKKMRLLPIGCEGQLVIGGDGVGAGYIHNEEATKNSFIQTNSKMGRVYLSGDIAKYEEDGNLSFLGRKDFQIKINGYRIEKSEIQNTALQFGRIKEVYLKIHQEDELKEMILYITSDSNIQIESLRDYMEQKLPRYMVPKKIMQVKTIPLNLNGKVDEKKLPKYVPILTSHEAKEPLTEMEELVLNCYQKILNVKELDVDSDLFEYGLDSLKIASSIVMLNRYQFNHLSYQDIYDLRTVRKIVKCMNGDLLVEEDQYVKEYDYTRIHQLLKKNSDSSFLAESIKGNVLLTGATGFLGAHLLLEILQTTSVKVCCIVRPKKISAKERLQNTFEQYFGEKLWKQYENRIQIISMDLLEEERLEEVVSLMKKESIQLILHSAATVKHYGSRELFYRLNVTIVENLIKLSKAIQAKLVHISTLSVSGNSFEGKFELQKFDHAIPFTENDLYIGQCVSNIYTYTKYVAEMKLLEEMASGFEATIIRVGNLTNSDVTGKSQINLQENGFIQRIRFLMDRKIISKDMYEQLYLEFSPVNEVAKAILVLSKIKEGRPIYHLFNHHHVTLKKFIAFYQKKYGKTIEILEDKPFQQKIDQLLKKEQMLKYSILIEEFHTNSNRHYKTNIKVRADKTNEVLAKNQFYWNEIEDRYLEQFINSILENGDENHVNRL